MIAATIRRRVCAPWCTQHDDEDDRCLSGYRFVSLSLEPPVTQFGETRPDQMATCVEAGHDGRPIVVTFCGDGPATTFTPQEAARYAMELWALATKAQGDER